MLLLRPSSKFFAFCQKANICHKSRMDPLVESMRPPPFDYTKYRFNFWRWMFSTDSTIARFTENTAIIVVDGPPGCNKTRFAKTIAEELGMKHFEEPNMDVEYVDDYNYDLRTLNRFLFRNAQFCDTDMMITDPTHPRGGPTQQDMLKIRLWYYLNYFTHLVSTGDGIVIERSPWSDVVFNEAFYKLGYFSKEMRDLYERKRHNASLEPWRPHIVLYIDANKEQCLKNIKKRNRSYEANSPLWESDFIDIIIDTYKNRVLPEYDHHSLVYQYPYKDQYDFKEIIEQLEEIDIYSYDLRTTKMEDWKIVDDSEWNEARIREDFEFWPKMASVELPGWDVPNYHMSDEAIHMQEEVEKNLRARRYDAGWDPDKEGFLKLFIGAKKDNYWYRRLRDNNWFRVNYINN